MPAPPPLSEPAIVRAMRSEFIRVGRPAQVLRTVASEGMVSKLNFEMRFVIKVPTTAVHLAVVHEFAVSQGFRVSVGEGDVRSTVMAFRGWHAANGKQKGKDVRKTGLRHGIGNRDHIRGGDYRLFP